MFGWDLRKSLKEKMLDNKLIEIVTEMKNFKQVSKTNLLNCKDVDMLHVYEDCTNRKQRRIALVEYYKQVKLEDKKKKRVAAIQFYKKK